jgi:serine/threonine protein kinase
MMMNHSLKNQYKLRTGTVISGKWHQNKYVIIRELGNGANGIVYLAEHKGNPVALKMSDNGLSVTSEVNVLKSFAKVPGSALGPSLLDVDDWIWNGRKVSFYVMEYIDGPDFLSFIQQKGRSWTVVLILQLLNDLEKLHQNGWVFGDLKPENLIVTGQPAKIRCIDVGGTTILGRAIKEFTEFYDRGYWGMGSRKADPSYDLFAVAMIFLTSAYPKRFNKKDGGILQLRNAIMQKPELKPYEQVITKALQGHYGSASQMRTELLTIVTNQEPVSPSQKPIVKNPKQTNQNKPGIKSYPSRKSYRKKRKKSGWLETLMIMMLVVCFYLMYLLARV